MHFESRPPLIVAMMAVRNRRDVTRHALQHLADLRQDESFEMASIVVDDGSSDGTVEMVSTEFPWANLIAADGTLFWGGAMRRAEEAALALSPAYVLWMNDDAVLDQDGIKRLLAIAQEHEGCVVTGAFRALDSEETTYSAVAEVRRGPFFSLRRLDPDPSQVTEAHSFNGNLVLFPADIYAKSGGIDPVFTHHYGDFDLGLRLRDMGVPILLAPGFVGRTSRNTIDRTFRDRTLSRRDRFRGLTGPKGYPPGEKRVYLRRHAGHFWFIQYVTVYAYYLTRIAIGR